MARRNRVVVRSQVKDVERRLRDAKGAEVGYLAETTGGQTYDNGLTLAANAAIHEKGLGTVPPRPFMTGGADRFEQAADRNGRVVAAIVEGRLTADEGSNRLGVMLKADIQEEIRDGNFTALDPETIRRKGSSKPLIDSGRLRQGVDVRTK